MNPALKQWIQDQKLKLFNTLRASAALQPRAGKPRRGTGGRTTTGLELGQTWDEVGTKLGRHEGPKRRRESPKSLQNPFQEGADDIPNRSRHAPWASSSDEKSHVTQQVAKKSRKSANSRPQELILGPKWDPKIHQKAARSQKSALPEAAGRGQGPVSYRSWWRPAFFLNFPSILGRFFMKIWWEKLCIFFQPCSFFSTWRPSR